MLVQKAGNYFTTAYLLILFGVYPFYLQDGYRDIATAKYYFLLYVSLGALAILAVLGLVQAVKMVRERIRNREAYLIDWDRLSVTDLSVMLYAAEILFSYTLSGYRKEAFWGTEGWYMGLVLRLVMCGLYFSVSRFYKKENGVWYVAAAGAFAVCALGILDRFSFYLIPLEVRSPEFISTLGNINWLCGYLSVLMPVTAVLFLYEEYSGRKWVLGGCVCVLFMTGFAQGGSSIFLIFGGLFFLLLWAAAYEKRRLVDWFLLGAVWGTAAQMVRLMRKFWPEGFNYGRDSLCGKMTDSGLTIPVIVIGVIGFCILTYTVKGKRAIDRNKARFIHSLAVGIVAVSVLVWLVLAVLNTVVGIPFLKENSSFLLNAQWGNGRGAAWQAGLMIFQKQTFLHKLIGIGPDCFSACAYSLPETAAYIRGYFGSSRLTNAHNELLTELINTGIAGAVLYFGIFFSSFYRCMRENTRQMLQGENTDFRLYIPAVSIGCYLLHNVVSFAQVLNFPLVILMAAIGEGLLQSSRQRTALEKGIQNIPIRQASIDE